MTLLLGCNLLFVGCHKTTPSRKQEAAPLATSNPDAKEAAKKRAADAVADAVQESGETEEESDDIKLPTMPDGLGTNEEDKTAGGEETKKGETRESTETEISKNAPCLGTDDGELKSFTTSFVPKQGGLFFFGYGDDTTCVTKIKHMVISVRIKEASGNFRNSANINIQNLVLIRNNTQPNSYFYITAAANPLKHNGDLEKKLQLAIKHDPDSVEMLFILVIEHPTTKNLLRKTIMPVLDNAGVRILAKMARYNVFEEFSDEQRSALNTHTVGMNIIKDEKEKEILKRFARTFIEALNE
ncbi:MAG: hypothetical protein OXC44_04430 [Proteobacteria bacterium]|nr:hypothetical protein [Pseudomonadota bacterium]